MAEAVVVSYVLSKLDDVVGALLNKAPELKDVSGQIEQMQLELRLIQALLRDADSKRNKNQFVTEWLNLVREIAKKIETVIDTFRDKIEGNRRESSNCLCLKKFKRNYKTYKLGLCKEIKDITGKLNWIYQRGTDLGIIKDNLGALDDVDDDPEPSDDKVDDPEVVGLEDDKGKIIEQLLDGEIKRRTVLSIVGTGGLGKTTLAQKVYRSATLEGQFNCRAWVSISQKYNLNDLLREIFYSVEPQMKKINPPVTDRDLPVKLKSSLRCKKYLIILDDVWDIDLWKQLKIVLPDLDNASRVIITTRSLDVAKAADCNTKPHELRYLSDAEGLVLLFKNAFQQQVQPENYPHLLEVAKRLTKKCGGIPLALVVLGGILTRTDRNYTAWNTLHETMDWHDKDGKECSQVLGRSYEELPDHLKPCFLYFSLFPEDYKISGEHITRMWIAEGFVPKDGAGTIEDRAEKFLQELVQRCLIQVTQRSWNGNCKYCSMHDLLRDLAIRKAKEENFFTIFSKEEEDVNQLAAIKPCRATLQFCTLTEDGVYSENTISLLCFGFGRKSSNDSGFRLLNYSGFRLLRVLTLEHVDMEEFARGQWPEEGLIHLRYLGFRYCNNIPQKIFNKISFYNLETIDLTESKISNEQEATDWSDIVIPTLRHVYGSTFIKRCLPLKWDHHTNLQTVKDVVLEREVAKLGCCINLRTLGINYVVDLDNERAIKEWQTLKGVLRRTEQLVFLSISVRVGSFLPFGGSNDLPCHLKIQRLYLDGKWGRNICVPSVEMFPKNLTKLTLEYTRLEEDPMPIFEKLQSLRILRLGIDSYEGTELICSTGGFPNLEKLQLRNLRKLSHWDIKKRAMPILSHLEINGCYGLHTLPELQNVETLQELLVVHPSRTLQRRMNGKYLHKIKHIPSVRITSSTYNWEDEVDLNDYDCDDIDLFLGV